MPGKHKGRALPEAGRMPALPVEIDIARRSPQSI